MAQDVRDGMAAEAHGAHSAAADVHALKEALGIAEAQRDNAIAECSALRRELFSLKQRLTDTYSSVPREPVVRSAYRDAGDGGRAGVFQQTVCIVSG
eukprot:m.53226 g.53226  ORF g.53226 m.53226 type:complete len:97 (-) comp15440_c0_seq2:375-665(-)